MSFKVQVGPPQISIHQGHTVLVTDPDGQINWPSDRGLYFFDTRLISAWAFYANGETWDLLNGGAVTYDSARVFLTNREFLTEDGIVPSDTLGCVLSRAVGGGLHEDIDMSNYGRKPVCFNLELAFRSDFADIFEVKSGKIVRRGRITTEWSEAHQRLRTDVPQQDFVRAVTVTARCDASSAVDANGRLSFEIRLEPGESWHACLLYDLTDGDKRYPAPRECSHHAHNRTMRAASRNGGSAC